MTHIYHYKHPILEQWLSGTTCHLYRIRRSVLFENDDYIVLKHNGHATYAGRFNPCLTTTCESYAKLYRKINLVSNSDTIKYGSNELSKWTGRIAKSKVLDDCKALGIIFDPKCEIDNGANLTPRPNIIRHEIQKMIDEVNNLTVFNGLRL
jgi:hypothetical protein